MHISRFLRGIAQTSALFAHKPSTGNRARPAASLGPRNDLREPSCELDDGAPSVVAMTCALQRTATLETENRELEAFVHSVRHELRAPLRTIDGFAKLLLEHCDERIGETAHHYLTCIVAAEQHMAELIDALLSFSRSAHADIRHSEIDMRNLISEIIADLQSHDPHRKVEATIEQLPAIQGRLRTHKASVRELTDERIQVHAASLDHSDPRGLLGHTGGDRVLCARQWRWVRYATRRQTIQPL